VQADTLAETQAALARWQAMPPGERATMASAAARLFRERYELSANAGRLLRLLEATNEGSPLPAM
jgi:acyl-CoA reductase-like NAD-dependent aldehyde dehydrogenase